MSSEPASPASVDPQSHLQQEIEDLKDKIKDLKEKLAQRDDSFAFYERSNQELQTQRTRRNATGKQKLRRQSSHFEDIVKANEKELRNLPELEKAIEDREAEVRNFTAELDLTRTERDDKITETKGLEGDIADLRQELETKDEELDTLHEKLNIFERHITISKDLPAEELDDVLYEFMEKWSAMQADGRIPSKKNKRASISGMNLADEFEALSDDGYDSEDGGYASDDRSIRSIMSERPAKKKLQQTLGMSEVKSVAIHPSVKKPVEMVSAGTQMKTQTSPIASPKKTLSQVISNGVQTSPIAALIQKFTPTMVNAQTSPVPRKSFAEFLSNGVHTSPVAPAAREREPLSEVMTSGVQTSPITPAAKEQQSFSEAMTSGVQTSPVAASKTKVASLLQSFTFSGTSSGVSTSPIAPSPKTAVPATTNINNQTSPIVSSPSSIPLPPSPASNSPITSKPTASNKSPLSNEITEEQLTVNDPLPSQPGKPSKVNTLNIKRPRVPTKDMSPQALSHYKVVTAPSTTKPSSTSSSNTSPELDIPALLTTFCRNIAIDAFQYWRLILLCVLASYIGSLLAAASGEYSWAHANGYAPENRYFFVAGSVLRQLFGILWGLLGWVWYLVFGGWFVGAGVRLPLSPG
ncbi:unnamed protein product [Aureobasidium mustum]|uniref:Uncharacterized protein n=1 Tax=Aureobasidium mustum TaxID=2773714 RepID=A0A9N8JZS3_9PEZI|nr:unnamed protein product [Aureobasidium mustum]